MRAPIKLLSPAEMATRREKGLCYYCDEQFVPGHKCKQKITYMIMAENSELDLVDEPASLAGPMENTNVSAMEEIQMTLNSISDEGGATTMWIFGQCGGHTLHILIDTGSTLSFIQAETAKKILCKISPTKPLLVKVANGQRMISSQ